ncbi:MAG: hypothetical protein ABR924_05680 [Terracidiphilus sp.]|jgi:hypothetical protein
MTISLRSARLIIAAACVCFALAVSPFAHSQAAPAATQQAKSAQPAPLDFSMYEFFFEIVGQEDAHIKADIREGKAQITPRQDYAAAMDISKDEEQTMLAIVVDFYNRLYNFKQQHNQESLKLFDQYDHDEAVKLAHEGEIAFQKKKNAMLMATISKLKTQLGEETFAKLTEYLRSGKFNGSYVYGVKEDIEGRPDPCPPNGNPPLGQTTHLACRSLYYSEVFQYIGQIDEGNRRAAAEDESEGTKPERFPLFNDLPEDRREAAFALGVEANRAIWELDQKATEEATKFSDQYIVKYGYRTALKMPVPPEVKALEMKRETTLEEYILKLKQVVGDDFFSNLDTYLSKENKTKGCIMLQPGAPCTLQTPAVQP